MWTFPKIEEQTMRRCGKISYRFLMDGLSPLDKPKLLRSTQLQSLDSIRYQCTSFKIIGCLRRISETSITLAHLYKACEFWSNGASLAFNKPPISVGEEAHSLTMQHPKPFLIDVTTVHGQFECSPKS